MGTISRVRPAMGDGRHASRVNPENAAKCKSRRGGGACQRIRETRRGSGRTQQARSAVRRHRWAGGSDHEQRPGGRTPGHGGRAGRARTGERGTDGRRRARERSGLPARPRRAGLLRVEDRADARLELGRLGRQQAHNASTRPARGDGHADAIAHAQASSSPTYSDGRRPVRNARSSHARSRSARMRRTASQTSGPNQNAASANRARPCVAASQRRTCANSCASTTRWRVGDHPAAPAGSRTVGRTTPHVIGTTGCAARRSSTVRSSPIRVATSLAAARHGPSVSGTPARAIRRTCQYSTMGRRRTARAPASQSAANAGASSNERALGDLGRASEALPWTVRASVVRPGVVRPVWALRF